VQETTLCAKAAPGLGQNTGNIKGPEDLPQDQNSSFQIPTYATFGNLRILVSPFMPFNTQTKTTDIIMCNSRNLVCCKSLHKSLFSMF
jgi:hypothetical protein